MAVSRGRPEFNDPLLRQALDEAAPNLEGFTARLDQLSSDIKNLESYLERSAFRIAVRVLVAPDRRYRSPRADEPYGDYIAWDKGDPERFRIICYRMEPGEVYPEEVDRNILIEAPLEVRVRAKSALPKLLRAVSEAAALGDVDQGGGPPAGDDDIPF